MAEGDYQGCRVFGYLGRAVVAGYADKEYAEQTATKLLPDATDVAASIDHAVEAARKRVHASEPRPVQEPDHRNIRALLKLCR